MSFRRKNSRRKPAATRKTRMKAYYKRTKRNMLKSANKKRRSLQMDPVPLRYHNFRPGTRPHQWANWSADPDNWSYVCTEFRAVSRTDDDYDLTKRPGNEARFIRSLLNLRIAHSASNRGEATYRVLLVKFLEMANISTSGSVTLHIEGTAVPRELILARASTSSEWRMSPYTKGKDRGDDYPKFKVIYDQTFTFSNVGDRLSTKILKIGIQGGRVRYKEDSSTGLTAKGHLALLVLTTASTSSSDRTFDFDYVCNFTASGG